MTTQISGTDGVSQVQAGSISQDDLAANVVGNGPAFSAYANASQSITSGVDTKVLVDSETVDTNANFSSSRFTPTVAGYYQINGRVRFNGTNITQFWLVLSKNGVLGGVNQLNQPASSTTQFLNVSDLVYLNGSTDYVELWGGITATSPSFSASANANTSYFSGFLARVA